MPPLALAPGPWPLDPRRRQLRGARGARAAGRAAGGGRGGGRRAQGRGGAHRRAWQAGPWPAVLLWLAGSSAGEANTTCTLPHPPHACPCAPSLCAEPREHKTLDLWLLLILHSRSEASRKAVEGLLRKKLAEGRVRRWPLMG
jgi:hypothetical protein